MSPEPAGREPHLDLMVHRMTREARGVLSVDLVRPDGAPLPAWEPGAHLDVHVGGLVRQYSLCGDPRDTGSYRIGVLDEPSSRGGSRHVHTRLRPGDPLTVVGPRNHFALEPAPAYVFVAGGIGVTPILPMAREAARRGVPFRLVHGGRTRASMAFGAELCELSGHGGTVALRPQDEYGLLDLDSVLAGLAPKTLVYCCGPEPLLAAARTAVPADRLRLERFAAPEAPDTVPGPGAAFEVECRASGVSVTVGAATSVLDAVEAAGIEVTHSCREGVCGSCETRVLEGVPEHRDFVLSEAEHAACATMMICVSRCASERLVLDL